MAEFDDDSGGTTSNGSEDKSAVTVLFIKVKSIPRVAYAREVRLREDDIILANNGKIFTQDIDEFAES